MSAPNTESTAEIAQGAPPPALSLRDVVEVLVKHYDLHEGLWDLNLEVRMGFGNFGPSEAERYPGATFGISRLGLRRAAKAGLHTVDAAVVNPRIQT